MNLPSIAKLAEIFEHRAAEARAILEANRATLETLPAGAARVRECYHPPSTADIRMHCLDAICDGSHGVESFQLDDGSWCDYLNTGDTYSVTLLRVSSPRTGRYSYRVGCWGDIAERRCKKGE